MSDATDTGTVETEGERVYDTPTTCPRCGGDRSSDAYYGVCERCRTELRATYSGEARNDVETAEYEPKMNVTPNAVALKE